MHMQITNTQRPITKTSTDSKIMAEMIMIKYMKDNLMLTNMIEVTNKTEITNTHLEKTQSILEKQRKEHRNTRDIKSKIEEISIALTMIMEIGKINILIGDNKGVMSEKSIMKIKTFLITTSNLFYMIDYLDILLNSKASNKK